MKFHNRHHTRSNIIKLLFCFLSSIKVPQVHLLPIESRKVLPNWNPNEGKASRFGMVDAPFVYQTTCQVDPMLNFSRHVHIFRLDILKNSEFRCQLTSFSIYSLFFVCKLDLVWYPHHLFIKQLVKLIRC